MAAIMFTSSTIVLSILLPYHQIYAVQDNRLIACANQPTQKQGQVPPFCPPTPPTGSGTITVTKHVINDNGGMLQASDFTIGIFICGTSSPVSSFPGSESGTTVALPPAPCYAISESFGAPAPGYSVSFAGDCRDPAGPSAIGFPLNPGEHRTCTITNNDNP